MAENQEKFLLKDHLFNGKKVRILADELKAAWPDFDAEQFVRRTLAGFKSRELKERISWMAQLLRELLPPDYKKAVKVILKALPPPLDPDRGDGDFGDFIYAPYCQFVATHGCRKEDLQFSLEALRQITQRFSAEDAIRYFLNSFPDETLERIHIWKSDSNYHVRRLCSEGLRPRLPWSQKVDVPLEAALPVLDHLHCDPTRYVTRSVANHLNDIARENPDLALKTLARWQRSGKQNPKEMEFILNHSLRGLIKAGHPEALKLLGYSPAPSVKVTSFKVPARVRMGESLEFSFKIQSQKSSNLIVDYLIHFRNKSGKLNAGKVFKIKKLSLEAGQEIEIKKSHRMQEKMTTRTLYPGMHYLELQINGQSPGKKRFELL